MSIVFDSMRVGGFFLFIYKTSLMLSFVIRYSYSLGLDYFKSCYPLMEMCME